MNAVDLSGLAAAVLVFVLAIAHARWIVPHVVPPERRAVQCLLRVSLVAMGAIQLLHAAQDAALSNGEIMQWELAAFRAGLAIYLGGGLWFRWPELAARHGAANGV